MEDQRVLKQLKAVLLKQSHDFLHKNQLLHCKKRRNFVLQATQCNYQIRHFFEVNTKAIKTLYCHIVRALTNEKVFL